MAGIKDNEIKHESWGDENHQKTEVDPYVKTKKSRV